MLKDGLMVTEFITPIGKTFLRLNQYPGSSCSKSAVQGRFVFSTARRQLAAPKLISDLKQTHNIIVSPDTITNLLHEAIQPSRRNSRIGVHIHGLQSNLQRNLGLDSVQTVVEQEVGDD